MGGQLIAVVQSSYPLVLAVHGRWHEHGDGIRPRDGLQVENRLLGLELLMLSCNTHRVLTPPSCHNDRDIETEYEGKRNQVGMLVTVLDDAFECSLLGFIENQTVGDIKCVVDEKKRRHIEPHEFVNWASPSVMKNPENYWMFKC